MLTREQVAASVERIRGEAEEHIAVYGEDALSADILVVCTDWLRLATGIKAIAECECLYRRDYYLLNEGTCADNGVFPGCVTCQARALLRKEEGDDAV